MKRANGHKLPQIAVEEETVAVRLSLPKELSDSVDRFAEWYGEVTGRKPLSQPHTMFGMLKQFLEDHDEFQKWNSKHPNGEPVKGFPYAMPQPGKTATRD
jgi:hypothetical protein